VKLLLDYSIRSSLQYWLFWGKCYEAILAEKTRSSTLRPCQNIDTLAVTPLHSDMLATTGGAYVGENAIARTAADLNGFASSEVLRFNAAKIAEERGPSSGKRAEALFMQSLALAREQGALSWELRTAISLARHWRQAGRFSEACDLLSTVYDQFTEGFSTLDLVAAKDLIVLLRTEVT
jgi:hypothetical protein